MIRMAPDAVLQGMHDLEQEVAYAKKKLRVNFDHAWRLDVGDLWLRLSPNSAPKRQRFEQPNLTPEPNFGVEFQMHPNAKPRSIDLTLCLSP